MKVKLGVLLIAAVIASVGIGTSYAYYTDEIQLSNSYPKGYCDVKFTGVTASDNEFESGVVDPKDVGSVSAQISEDRDAISVQVDNAYPLYKAYVDFTIKNVGNKPINVNMVASDYENTALDIEIDGVKNGDVLGVGESINGRVTVEVLQGAEQNTVYGFTVSFGFYNEECPQYTHVETVIVDADNPDPTLSDAILENGVSYTLVATGTAFAGDTIDFDAKYSITHRISSDTWTDSVSGYTGYGPTLLDLFVNGVPGGWGAYNEDHTYECTITGDGSQVELWIYDIYYQNNMGSLTVDIYKIIS